MAVRHHIKVLVVDDEATVCDTVALILEEAGYKPLKFNSPTVALESAEQEAFQIAVIDQRMPEMDGIKVVERLKQIDGRICCILMTAYPDLATATAAMREGTCDYLSKPFKREGLLASVDRACQRLGLIYRCEADLNRLIGQRIRTERQRQNLTLRQVSVRSDLTTSQLSQVELGKNAASMWALARISNALGMQLSQLLQGL
jgi:DNA-binding NtrC family response regulator